MRAPRIPTESFGLSIGVGALVPLFVVFSTSMLPESLTKVPVFFSPFVSGFAASLTYGALGRPCVRQSLIGAVAFLAFYFLLWGSVIALGFRPTRELGVAMYITAFPPFLLAPVVIATFGSIFGWLAALALRR